MSDQQTVAAEVELLAKIRRQLADADAEVLQLEKRVRDQSETIRMQESELAELRSFDPTRERKAFIRRAAIRFATTFEQDSESRSSGYFETPKSAWQSAVDLWCAKPEGY